VQEVALKCVQAVEGIGPKIEDAIKPLFEDQQRRTYFENQLMNHRVAPGQEVRQLNDSAEDQKRVVRLCKECESTLPLERTLSIP
jgi:hypothetical protein